MNEEARNNGSLQTEPDFDAERAESVERRAASLAPAEEQASHATSFPTKSFHLSKSFADEEARGAHLFAAPHKIVVVLILLALCFIGFIAYLITNTPSPNP